MNRAIELHDSTIGAITPLGAGLVAVEFVPAYIHESAGDPGGADGTGWTQTARMTLAGATISGELPLLPCDLSDGVLRSGDMIMNNLIPLPFSGAEIELRLLFNSGNEVTITAAKADLRAEGQATYVEEVP